MRAWEQWEQLGRVTLPTLSGCQRKEISVLGTVGTVKQLAMCVCVHVRVCAREEKR